MNVQSEYLRLRRNGVPEGYATRMVLSHHEGGWAPCAGFPECIECRCVRAKAQARQEARGANSAVRRADTPGKSPAAFKTARLAILAAVIALSAGTASADVICTRVPSLPFDRSYSCVDTDNRDAAGFPRQQIITESRLPFGGTFDNTDNFGRQVRPRVNEYGVPPIPSYGYGR